MAQTTPGDRIVLSIRDGRNALADYGREIALLDQRRPSFAALARASTEVVKSLRGCVRTLKHEIIKLKKSEEQRSEMSLSVAYNIILAQEAARPSTHDGFDIARLVANKQSRMIKDAHDELPRIFALTHDQVTRMRAAWAFTIVTIYRAAIQQSRAEGARVIFDLLDSGRLDDRQAYFLAKALNLTNPHSWMVKPELYSNLLELLLQYLEQIVERSAQLADLVLSVQARGAEGLTFQNKGLLQDMAVLLVDELGRLETTARRYVDFRPALALVLLPDGGRGE